VIVFNGEIYNHREIRRELERLGHRFRSQCDTETVLRAFMEWDTACFERMRGMFGVALWSEARKRLVLARDRMGIKPLYYYRSGDDCTLGANSRRFWSTATFRGGWMKRAAGPVLSVNYVPGDRTLIEGIRKVPPGHLLEWSPGKCRIEAMWELPREGARRYSLEAAKEELERLLRESVREHLVFRRATGSVGFGRSGSSTILHYAAEQSGSRLKTFSISFRGRRFRREFVFPRSGGSLRDGSPRIRPEPGD